MTRRDRSAARWMGATRIPLVGPIGVWSLLVAAVGGCGLIDERAHIEGSVEWIASGDIGAYEPCVPTSLPARAAEVVTEISDSSYPCVLVEMPLELVLGSNMDDSIPDLSVSVVRNSRYTYFTTVAPGTSGRVMAWNREGGYEGVYGRRGEGPGEFAGMGELLIMTGPGDSLYVLDDRNRWTVLSENLSFSRVFAGTHNGRRRSSLHILANGDILWTGLVAAQQSRDAFRIADNRGELVRSFGNIPADYQPSGNDAQSSVMSSDTSFWVAPLDGSTGGILLEEWSIDGTRLRHLKRNPPWLPSDGYSNQNPREPRLPSFALVQRDDNGWLWLAGLVRDARWRPISAVEGERGAVATPVQPPSMQYDAFLEVIDPEAGAVLASVRFDDPADEGLPFTGGFPGSRDFYRVVTDSLGFNSIAIFSVMVAERIE